MVYSEFFNESKKEQENICSNVLEMCDKAYRQGVKDAEKKHNSDLDYKNGLEKGRMEAWECAKKLILNKKDGGLSTDEIKDIFAADAEDYTVFKNLSASEAIAKMKEYEQTDEMSMEYAITTLKYQYDNGQMEQDVHEALGMAIKSMEYIDDHAL